MFNNKYRIPSARLQNWNYANERMYFVSICTKNRENYFGKIVATDISGKDTTHCVSAFAPQSKNLSSIIRGYKSAVTTYARKNGIDFHWQPRFHDHIIRTMDAYCRISNYIINNPAKWLDDKFHQL